MIKKVKPNKAHQALAELETTGNLRTVITQNIDGLHQEAGSSSVIELHGTTRIIYCLNCSYEYSMDEVFSMLEVKIPPLCSKCKGKLRPAVVFFGEVLTLETSLMAEPKVKICFEYKLYNDQDLLVGTAATTLAFLDSKSNRPIACPENLLKVIQTNL